MYVVARGRAPYLAPSGRRPAGFTLVEMLVVITIIGILAGLTVPVVFNAIRTARNAAIITEMAAIEKAVEEYKIKFGDYPVDFTEYTTYSSAPAWNTTIAGRHLRKISRRATTDFRTRTYTQAAAFNGSTPPAGFGSKIVLDQLDPAEALVFCLRGYSKNVASPWDGVGGPMDFRATANRTPIYDFDEKRLEDPDGDGFPHYVPPHGPPVPYVYFDSRTYNRNNAFYNPTASLVSRGVGEARAYLSEASTTTVRKYMNAKKFQIICAGLDGDYGGKFTSGNRTTRKAYPNGGAIGGAGNAVGYSREDNDNLSNFSGDLFENKFED